MVAAVIGVDFIVVVAVVAAVAVVVLLRVHRVLERFLLFWELKGNRFVETRILILVLNPLPPLSPHLPRTLWLLTFGAVVLETGGGGGADSFRPFWGERGEGGGIKLGGLRGPS